MIKNTVILIEHRNLHVGNRPVMFVTHKRFVDLFFVPSWARLLEAWLALTSV